MVGEPVVGHRSKFSYLFSLIGKILDFGSRDIGSSPIGDIRDL